MRLKGFDYGTEGAYFITICAKDMRHVFGEVRRVRRDEGIAPYMELSFIGLVCEKYIKRIPTLKYVIMPNHIHIIIINNQREANAAPQNAVIPRTIRSFKILVTKEPGFSPWQRSYHDHIIRNEADYLRIWKYIDENPLKWELDKYYAGRDAHIAPNT